MGGSAKPAAEVVGRREENFLMKLEVVIMYVRRKLA